jgi:hypothetical protein
MHKQIAITVMATAILATTISIPTATDATAGAVCGWLSCWRPCTCCVASPWVYYRHYWRTYRPLLLYRTFWGGYRPRGFFTPVGR